MFHKLGVAHRFARNAADLAEREQDRPAGRRCLRQGDVAAERVRHARDHGRTRCACEGVPILGICVGMQILADNSEEGKLAGLGLVEGSVRSIASLAGTRRPRPAAHGLEHG